MSKFTRHVWLLKHISSCPTPANYLFPGPVLHLQYVHGWSVELHRLRLPWFVSLSYSGSRWLLEKESKCPLVFAGECSVTGDMYFQSFDGRIYTFSATCQYVLAKSRSSGRFTVTIQNAPCGAVSFFSGHSWSKGTSFASQPFRF